MIGWPRLKLKLLSCLWSRAELSPDSAALFLPFSRRVCVEAFCRIRSRQSCPITWITRAANSSS